MKPLAIELFAGLHGWGEGFVAEGFRVVGFDVVDMSKAVGHPRPEGVELVLQDVLTLDGAQFRNADCIVASPPCQAYSYRAMPWKKAKALPPPDNTLFDACFRIQREASEAAGRYIPMVVENVCGAQRWVGRAKYHFGSYYLWGDVPALMPYASGRKSQYDGPRTEKPPGTGKTSWFFGDSKGEGRLHGLKVPGFNFHGYEKTGKSGGSFQSAPVKSVDPSYGTRGWFGDCGGTNVGKVEGGGYAVKNGADWFGSGDDCSLQRRFSSRSDARKQASALIAKIPFPLASHIARCFKP